MKLLRFMFHPQAPMSLIFWGMIVGCFLIHYKTEILAVFNLN